MPSNNDQFGIRLASEPNDFKEINKIMKELLLTPKMLEKMDDETRKRYSYSGFVIGVHSLEVIKKWINIKENFVYVVESMNKDKIQRKVTGYALVLGTPAFIKNVQKYAEDVQFIDVDAKNTIEQGNFVYLIQIAIKKEFQNKKIGSKLFRFIKENIQVPIVSFVIKNPLLNKPSLYTHLKNGYQFFGYYSGPYDNFLNYRSVGLILKYPSELPSKPIVQQIFRKIEMEN
ncbi:MAG: GNAT family N-acetyltransferase [Promethearchaeota archaeon]